MISIELAIVIGVVCYILGFATIGIFNYADDGVNMNDEYSAYLRRECEQLGKSGTQSNGNER